MRYLDSELHLRTNVENRRSPVAFSVAEIQSTTLDIGLSSNNDRQVCKVTSETTDSKKNGDLKLGCTISNSEKDFSHQEQQKSKINRNCEVCLIKEIRLDLMKIHRIVQERNEHISKLKANLI